MRTLREKLLEEIEAKNYNPNVSINEAQIDLQKMRCTYLKRSSLQFHLITPMEALANRYRQNLEHKKSAKCFEDIFELTKDYNDFVSVNMLIEALIDYKKTSQSKTIETIKQISYEYFESISFYKFYYEKIWQKMLQKSEN